MSPTYLSTQSISFFLGTIHRCVRYYFIYPLLFLFLIVPFSNRLWLSNLSFFACQLSIYPWHLFLFMYHPIIALGRLHLGTYFTLADSLLFLFVFAFLVIDLSLSVCLYLRIPTFSIFIYISFFLYANISLSLAYRISLYFSLCFQSSTSSSFSIYAFS